jgi:hypothetical protein
MIIVPQQKAQSQSCGTVHLPEIPPITHNPSIQKKICKENCALVFGQAQEK